MQDATCESMLHENGEHRSTRVSLFVLCSSIAVLVALFQIKHYAKPFEQLSGARCAVFYVENTAAKTVLPFLKSRVTVCQNAAFE